MRKVENPPNPFEAHFVEYFEGIVPPAKLEIYEDTTRTILARNDSPDLGFRWSLNPYRGCFHACAYCLHGETRILMADGRTRSLADLRVGDEVYGTIRHGDYRRYTRTQVLAHWSTVKPAYRIRLEDGTELIASADHRFLTNRGWKYVTGSENGAMRRPHLTHNVKLMGTGYSGVPRPADEGYQRGYLAGMIRGDGMLGTYQYDGRRRAKDVLHQFRLALIDGEALWRTRQYLSDFDVATIECAFGQPKVGYQPMRAIRTSARRNVERIRELIEWPTANNEEWSRGFLAGIFDAEGSYSQGILRITNSNSDILNRISSSLRHLGFDCVTEARKERTIQVVRLLGGLREALRFFHCVDPAISRKQNIEKGALKNDARLRVINVQPLGIELPMFDITTGTGDFIANGVVSHNCYARPSHEYLGFGAGTDFETKILVKLKAPELLREAFLKPSWKGELIVFSGDTDCYQPLEASYQLTRQCLEVCLEFGNPAGIVTKSFLIVRDLELLKRLYERTHLSISISIPFFDEKIARLVEPNAASIRKRFEAVRLLAEAGINIGILVAPIIPGLNDSDIPQILKRAKECGARSASPVLLRLSGSVKPVFISRIRKHFPLQAEKILHRIREVREGKLTNSNFGERHSGKGPYWENVEKLFYLSCEKLGLNRDERPSPRPPFGRPTLQKELALYG